MQRPHRLARSRTPAFHAGNTGSNPVGDAMTILRGQEEFPDPYFFHGAAIDTFLRKMTFEFPYLVDHSQT